MTRRDSLAIAATVARDFFQKIPPDDKTAMEKSRLLNIVFTTCNAANKHRHIEKLSGVIYRKQEK